MGRKATYVQAVCVLTPLKYETHRVRLAEWVNLVGDKIYTKTTTENAVTIKTHRNRSIYDKMGSTPA